MRRDQETYAVNGTCSNCGHMGKVEFSKGEKAVAAVCPYCGCHAFQPSRIKFDSRL
jgi:predicted  nucleic acid-binding Zn-ribbon protein